MKNNSKKLFMKHIFTFFLSLIPNLLWGLKISLLITATNNYLELVPPLIKSAKKNFLPNHFITFFIFTDQNDHSVKTKLQDDPQVVLLYQKHLCTPLTSSLRFKTYIDNQSYYQDSDYIFILDAPIQFLNPIDETILNNLVGVIHNKYVLPKIISDSYFFNPHEWSLKKKKYPFDMKKQHPIYVRDAKYYYNSSFFGGSASAVLTLCKECCAYFQHDLNTNTLIKNGYENYLNFYFHINHPESILSPFFLLNEDKYLTFNLINTKFPKLLKKNNFKLSLKE